MNKVSIVIPVYNSAEFLPRCIESLLAQTYSNIEIILVNDGSTDSSLEICKKYEQTDARVKVFDKNNSGVGSARNYGLKQCSGEYICFVDSDDYVSAKYCEILLRNLKDNSADLSIISLALKECEAVEGKIEIVNKLDAYYQVLFDNTFFGYPVNKLYKKEIIDKLGESPFPEELYWGEDLVFNIRYLMNCSKIIKQDIALYYYIQNEDSCTNKPVIDERSMTLIKSCKKVIDIYREVCKGNIDYAWLFYFYNLEILKKRKATKNQKLILKREEKKALKEIKNSRIINKKTKMKVYMQWKMPIIFNVLNNLIIRYKNRKRR